MRTNFWWAAILSSFLLSVANAGPFGLEKGMSKSELGEGWQEIDGTPGYYVSRTPPKAHSAFESYVAKLSPSQGLCWIKAIGKDISTNGYGSRLKSEFEDLRERLNSAYGDSELTDVLVSGSIWDDADDWMMGLRQKDRYYMAEWSDKSGAKLKDDVTMIGLVANATRSDVGYLSLEYYFDNADACDAELDAAEDDAL